MKICPKCGLEHQKPGTFCSRTCANSHVRTEESKKKTSISNKAAAKLISKEDKSAQMKRAWDSNPKKKHGPYTPISFRKCNHCGNIFTSPFNRSWCTDQCFLEIKRKNWQGNEQRYKNESFDSSWEVDLVKWFELNNIKFETKPNSIPWVDSTGKSHKYFPDFYLPDFDLYVDPKNRIVVKMQKEKLDCISSKINLVYGELETIKEHILNRLKFAS